MTVFHPGQVVYWAWPPGEYVTHQAGAARVNKGTVVVHEVPEIVYCKLDGEEAYMYVSSSLLKSTRAEVEREIAAALLGAKVRG